MLTQFDDLTELPQPDHSALAISQMLTDVLHQRIEAANGVLPFDQYMSSVLYEPALGYYSAGSRKFGEAGDFITAPEISPLFSRCLANQCAEVLSGIDNGIILELGAGSGVMAKELLLELQRLEQLPDEYWIMEVSADLKQRQQTCLKQTLPNYYERIIWLDTLADKTFSGVLLANEVLDALPVKRVVKTEQEFFELGVSNKANGFSWQLMPLSAELESSLTKLSPAVLSAIPEDYRIEINIGLHAWLSTFAQCLKKGVMLFIDYGESEKEFYYPQKQDGNLLCHYRHRAHADPFLYPGLQDITCPVNFTALARSADSIGLQVSAYTTQAFFLLACGLESLSQNELQQGIEQSAVVSQQVRTLTLPEEMGERFKVMALTQHYPDALRGFAFMDQRGRL